MARRRSTPFHTAARVWRAAPPAIRPSAARRPPAAPAAVDESTAARDRNSHRRRTRFSLPARMRAILLRWVVDDEAGDRGAKRATAERRPARSIHDEPIRTTPTAWWRGPHARYSNSTTTNSTSKRQQQAQIQRRDHTDHGCRPFAAAKLEPHRIDMPHDHGESAGHVSHSRDSAASRPIPGNAAVGSHHTANTPLATSISEHQESKQLTLSAQRVGRTRIAAAHRRISTPAHPAEDRAAQQRPEQVGDEQLDAEFQHRLDYDTGCSFALLGFGRCTSASMQRTPPPPMRSMVGMLGGNNGRA